MLIESMTSIEKRMRAESDQNDMKEEVINVDARSTRLIRVVELVLTVRIYICYTY